MRKWLAVLLAAVLLLVTGCASENRNADNGVPKPTKQQQLQMDAYYDIVSALDVYADTGILQLTDPETEQQLTGQTALQYAYLSLLTMEELDPIIGTKWHDPDAYPRQICWDRKRVLDAFHKVGNVLLSVQECRTDAFGNVTWEPESYAWQYNLNGTLAASHREAVIGLQALPNKAGGVHSYDSAGKLARISYRDKDGNVTEERSFLYDAEGRLTQVQRKTGQGTEVFAYTYDAQDRLTQISWEDILKRAYTLTYTYDPQGNVLTEEGTTWMTENVDRRYISDTYTMEYVYEAGTLTGGALTYRQWQASWSSVDGQLTDNSPMAIRREAITFETDKKGNVVKKTVQGADLVNIRTGKVLESAQYAQKVTQYRYGDYLIYIPQ